MPDDAEPPAEVRVDALVVFERRKVANEEIVSLLDTAHAAILWLRALLATDEIPLPFRERVAAELDAAHVLVPDDALLRFPILGQRDRR